MYYTLSQRKSIKLNPLLVKGKCHSSSVDTTGQLPGVSSLHLSCGCQRWNSGPQTLWQASSPTELSYWLQSLNLLLIKSFYPNLAFMLFSFWIQLILNLLKVSCVFPDSFLFGFTGHFWSWVIVKLQIYSIHIFIFWLNSVYSVFIICLCKMWSHTRQNIGLHLKKNVISDCIIRISLLFFHLSEERSPFRPLPCLTPFENFSPENWDRCLAKNIAHILQSYSHLHWLRLSFLGAK